MEVVIILLVVGIVWFISCLLPPSQQEVFCAACNVGRYGGLADPRNEDKANSTLPIIWNHNGLEIRFTSDLGRTTSAEHLRVVVAFHDIKVFDAYGVISSTEQESKAVSGATKVSRNVEQLKVVTFSYSENWWLLLKKRE